MPVQPSADARALDALIGQPPTPVPPPARHVQVIRPASAPAKARSNDSLDDQVASPDPEPIPFKPAAAAAPAADAEPEPAVDAPDPAPKVAAIVPATPSSDARALDALIDFTPAARSNTGAAPRAPVPAPRIQTRRTTPPQGDDSRLIDPNEIQRMPIKRIQPMWY